MCRARQFRQQGLTDIAERALRDADLEARFPGDRAHRERAVMYDPGQSAKILESLSRIGVQIAIDDSRHRVTQAWATSERHSRSTN